MTAAVKLSADSIILTEDPTPSRGYWHKLLGNRSHAFQLYFSLGYLGLAFSILFTGFNVTQSFITTIFPGSFGYTVMFEVYTIYGLSALVAPLIIKSQWLGRVSRGHNEKLILFVSSLGFTIFVATVAAQVQTMVLIGAALCGLCCGTLWIAQGVWVTKSVNHYLEHTAGKDTKIVGTATGVFFTLFNINAILGNLIAISFLSSGDPSSFKTLLWIMMGLVGLSNLLLTQSPQLFSNNNASLPPPLQAERKDEMRASTENIAKIFRLFHNRKTMLLTPYLICQGANVSFNFGNFPTFISCMANNNTASNSIPASANDVPIKISTAFLVYGIGSIIGSLLWGRVYDRSNSRLKPLLNSHIFIVSLFTSIILSVTISPILSASTQPLLIFVGFLLGLNDFLTNSIINNSISKLYKGSQVARMFSWYRFCFCIGFALNSAISVFVPRVDGYFDKNAGTWTRYGWLVNIVLGLFLMLVSAVCGHLLDRFAALKATSQDDEVYVIATAEVENESSSSEIVK